MKAVFAVLFTLLVFVLHAQYKKESHVPGTYKAQQYNLLRNMNKRALEYWGFGDFEKALEEYRDMLQLAEQTKNLKYEAMALNNIGFIYTEFGDYQTSIEYRKKALFIRENIGDSLGIGLSHNGLGMAYFSMDSIEKAIYHFDQAMKYVLAINDSLSISNVQNNIGNVFIKTGDFQKALESHNKALEIRILRDDQRGIAESYKNLSNYYIKTGDMQLARQMIEKGFEIAEEIQSVKMRKLFYYQLYLLNESGKNFKLALENYIHFAELEDSLASAESRNYINKLMVQYDTERKEQEIAILNVQNLLSEEELAKKRNTLWLLTAILLTLGIFITFLAYLYNQKRKAYKALVRMNIEAAKCDHKQNGRDHEKYKTSALDDDHKRGLLRGLNQIMKEEKPFLTSDCTIDNLAKKLNSNRQYLSQLINQHFGKNFNAYINEFRIKEARKILIEDEKNRYSIEGVADMVGFQSRTSFINAFKKYTGVTPSFFKENRKNI
ncbi:MAG: tetratricopeptide repeat protein [Bacteroidales bacterium]|nr:tetratricopeptide repeat protein [Bacteroidales bacterium]